MRKESVDFLVIGGGAAGCAAAIAATEGSPRLSVGIAEKATLRRGGCVATGIDHWVALSPRFFEGTGVRFFRDFLWKTMSERATGDAMDPTTASPTLFDESYEELERLERWGIDVRLDDGRFRIVWAAGAPTIWIEGAQLKPILEREVKKAGCKIWERTQIVGLLRNADRVTGAFGFNVRTGEFLAIEAKAVLVATGSATRLWKPYPDSSDERVFDLVYSPYNNGEGIVAAYEVGAEVSSAEFVACTVSPADYGTAGISGFLSAGCRLVNSLGESFSERYDRKLKDSMPRQKMVHACWREIIEGRGPIAIDTSAVKPEDVPKLYNAWANEVPVMRDYVEKKGIAIGRDRVEAEIHLALSTAKVTTNWGMKTNLPGLTAAGDGCETVAIGVVGAMIGGRRAAASARERVAEIDSVKLDEKDLEDRRAKTMASMGGTNGDLGWRRVEDELRRINTRYLGLVRNGPGIERAKREIEALAEKAKGMRARDWHDLMRIQETRSLLTLSRLMAVAAATRTESRFGNGHFQFRSDFPRTEKKWARQVVLTRGENGRPSVEVREIPDSRPMLRAYLRRHWKQVLTG